MHPLLGEVAPAAPALLEPLLALAFFLVALGVLALVTYIVYGIVKILDATVGKVPGVGGILSDAAHGIASIITDALGRAVTHVDNAISFWWHALGEEIAWIGRELEASARAVEALAERVQSTSRHAVEGWIRSALHAALHGVSHLAREALDGVHKLEQLLTHAGAGTLGRELHLLLRPIRGELHTLERWTYPKVKALEHEVGTVVEPDIQALKDRATTLEDQAIRVYKDAAGVWHAVSTDALAAAVALALPALGLQWARCGNVGGAGRALCGLGSDLVSALLGDALTAFAVTDTCDFVAGAQDVANALEPALLAFVDAELALVGCHGADAAADLALPALILPPTNLGLPLAA